jgi:hypothetical protein
MVLGVEVVDIDPSHRKLLQRLKSIFNKNKLVTALALDIIDLFFANVPLLNTIWDIITCAVLLVILKNKYLAFFALWELILPGKGFWIKEADAFIPTATILYFIDKKMSKFKIVKHPFHKEFIIGKK